MFNGIDYSHYNEGAKQINLDEVIYDGVQISTIYTTLEAKTIFKYLSMF